MKTGRVTRKSGLARAMAVGLGGGAIATIAMTAVLWSTKKAGLLGQLPPKKIVRSLRRRMGIVGVSRKGDDTATAIAHLGFGMATGAIFGAFHRSRWGWPGASLLGASYGGAVWTASYCGWIPALGIMPPPKKDRPFRPSSMVLAHLVYGAVLGATVDALSAASPPTRMPMVARLR